MLHLRKRIEHTTQLKVKDVKRYQKHKEELPKEKQSNKREEQRGKEQKARKEKKEWARVSRSRRQLSIWMQLEIATMPHFSQMNKKNFVETQRNWLKMEKGAGSHSDSVKKRKKQTRSEQWNKQKGKFYGRGCWAFRSGRKKPTTVWCFKRMKVKCFLSGDAM